MKAYLTLVLIAGNLIIFEARPQTIVGTWQLIRQTTCLDEEMDTDEETSELVDDMESRSRGTGSVIRFKDNNTGDESLRMIDSRKSSGKQPFLYRFDGEKLYLLDKKSQTIVGSYDVENLTPDSLIFTNATRVCETRVFVRVSEE